MGGDGGRAALRATLTTTASRSILGSRHRFWLRTPNAGEVRISCSRPSSRTGRRPASRSIKPGEITIRPSRTLAKSATAFEIRDRALAGLPDYSRWLPFYEAATAELTTLVLDLWDKTHALSDLLEPENGTDLTRLPDIQRRAEDLKKDFLALEDQFQRHVGNLESTRREQDWEAAVAAAAVAFPDNDNLKLRNDILVRLDNIRESDIAVAKNITERKSTISEPDEQQSELALQGSRRRAGLQALMALAVIGERSFKEATDTEKKGGEDEFKIASDHVRNLRSTSASETWWKEAEAVGELIGQRWRWMSRELNQSKRITDYATLQSRLARLDRFGRLIDAGAEPLSDEPEWTTRLRETRVHDVLLWLADRAWEDHWYNDNPHERPFYYETAVFELAQRFGGPSREFSGHPHAQERLRLQRRARTRAPRSGFDRPDQRAERLGCVPGRREGEGA